MTGREHTIIGLVAEGHSNNQIAHILNISVKTVENLIRASIMRKLNLRLHGRIGALRRAQQADRGLRRSVVAPSAQPVQGRRHPSLGRDRFVQGTWPERSGASMPVRTAMCTIAPHFQQTVRWGATHTRGADAPRAYAANSPQKQRDEASRQVPLRTQAS